MNYYRIERTFMEDTQFLEYVVKALVDNPNDVKIERTVDEMGVLITLKVSQEDLGQIIGRQGQTAKSLRTLLRVVGAKHHARVNLKIYEPEGSRKARHEARAEQPAQDAPMMDAGDDLKI